MQIFLINLLKFTEIYVNQHCHESIDLTFNTNNDIPILQYS